MKKEKWYKRLLCGYNPLGNLADRACEGTETTRALTTYEKERGTIEVRCWCCTFWRGVVVGLAAGLLTAVVL